MISHVAWNILLLCFKAVWPVLSSREFISALSGAFFGAAGAYLLESRRRRREKKDREYEAFLRTQAVIISQGNSLGWIANDYPSKDSFNNYRTFTLRSTRQMVDFKDLAFIAKSSDPQLLIELDIANESYDFFRTVLESRNAAIQEFLRHPETVIRGFDANTGNCKSVEGSELLMFNLRKTNDSVADRLAYARRVNGTTMERLLRFAQREFPGRQVLRASENAASTNTA